MSNNSKKSVFLYNKRNELVTYAEFSKQGRIMEYYNLSGRVLTKMNIERFKEKNKWVEDIKNAQIVFDEDCKLFHMFLDGDTYCKAIRINSRTLESPKASSKIYSFNEDAYEGYTVNAPLIKKWLEKL